MNQCLILGSTKPTTGSNSASSSNGQDTSLSHSSLLHGCGYFPLTTDFALHRKVLSFCGSLPEFPVSLQWQPLDGAILSAITAAVIHTLLGPSPTAAHAYGLGLTCATAATGQSNTAHGTFLVPWGNESYCKSNR